MDEFFSKQNILEHLTLWKIFAGFIFIVALLFVGDIPSFMVRSLCNTKNKWVNYLYSTLSILGLFIAFKLLNAACDLFITIANLA